MCRLWARLQRYQDGVLGRQTESSMQRALRGEGAFQPETPAGRDVSPFGRASKGHSGRCVGPAAWLCAAGLVERQGSARVPASMSHVSTACSQLLVVRLERKQRW